MSHTLLTPIQELSQGSYYEEMVASILKSAKTKGATACEVGVQVSLGLSLTVRMQEVETVEFNRDKAVSLTVYKGKKKGSASTNDLSKEAIEHTINAALNLAGYTEEDPYSGLAEKESMAKKVVDCDLYHPWALSVEEAQDLAKSCEHFALETDKRIENSDGASLSTGQGYYVYGNSHGFIGGYPTSRHSFNSVVIAKDESGMQRDYQYTISRNPKDLWDAKKVGVESAQRALSRLSSRRLATQTLPVIFAPEIAGGLFSQFCGAISGSRLYRKSSFLIDSINTQVFHPAIQIAEAPHLKQGMGSAPFDNDGVATHPRKLVEDGRVNGYILSAYSARKLGLPNTGNAGGVHNLMITPSKVSLNELIKGQSKALLVTELMGQGVNMVTGDYSRGAAGFYIENGEIQYPVHEITIAGNLKDMYKNMSCVTLDIETRGNIQTGAVLIDSMMLAGD